MILPINRAANWHHLSRRSAIEAQFCLGAVRIDVLQTARIKSTARRMIHPLRYPLERSSSAKYEPSCPVIPVISAFFAI